MGHPALVGRQRRRPGPGRVGAGLPRVALVAPQVRPGREVGVVILAARLEQVRMVGAQHGGHAGVAQRVGDGPLPHLDRSPRPPQEVERAGEDVVTGRHARQRPDHVAVEAHRPGGKPVEVRSGELVRSVGTHVVAVQAVEQHHDDVAGCDYQGRRFLGERHGATMPRGRLHGGDAVVAVTVTPARPAASRSPGSTTGRRAWSPRRSAPSPRPRRCPPRTSAPRPAALDHR